MQLYGPYAQDLPHFDMDGTPILGTTRTIGAGIRLSSELQIATSEGCCKRVGSGIKGLLTPGRYVLLVFHCSIGANEHRPYKVTYTVDRSVSVPVLPVGVRVVGWRGGSRSVSEVWRIVDADGGTLVTRAGEVYRVSVNVGDEEVGGQVRVGVFTYGVGAWSGEGVEEEEEGDWEEGSWDGMEKGRCVGYDAAYHGKSVLTFEVSEDQV